MTTTPEQKKLRYEKNRDFIQTYKLEKGCEICGYNKSPAALSFDHIDPQTKDKTLVKGNRGAIRIDWSLPRIVEEIAKCRVICMNCHMEHTHDIQKAGTLKFKQWLKTNK